MLSPSAVDDIVTIGTHIVAVDPTGSFRLSGYALVEGRQHHHRHGHRSRQRRGHGNRRRHRRLHAAVADHPRIRPAARRRRALRAAGRHLVHAQRTTAAAPPIELTTESTIDGTATTSATTIVTATGGHIVDAIARDLAGNETRVERTFFIGATGGGSGRCEMSGFDPADGAVDPLFVDDARRPLRTASAGVNDHVATVLDGSFLRHRRAAARRREPVISSLHRRATVRRVGDPVTLTLHRVTGDPSITIDHAGRRFVTADETITVTGTVGPGVTIADVNGQRPSSAAPTPAPPAPYTATGCAWPAV